MHETYQTRRLIGSTQEKQVGGQRAMFAITLLFTNGGGARNTTREVIETDLNKIQQSGTNSLFTRGGGQGYVRTNTSLEKVLCPRRNRQGRHQHSTGCPWWHRKEWNLVCACARGTLEEYGHRRRSQWAQAGDQYHTAE